MNWSLNRLARRALIERKKDLYYHDLMQLRREQQLEAIRQVQPPKIYVPVSVKCPQPKEHCHVPDVVPEYIIVSEDDEMPSPGPSSRDWMLVVMLVLGTAGMTLALCFLLFLVVNVLMGGDGGTGGVTNQLVR